MDLHEVLACVVVGFFTAVLVLFHRHRSHFTAANLPAGNIGYPFIGETLHFLSAGWKGHSESFVFERTREFKTEVFKTSLLGEPMAVFSGAACNKFLFSNENKLVTTWWPSTMDKLFPSSLQSSSGSEAKKLRGLLHAFLRPEALRRYVAAMDGVARRRFDADWAERPAVETVPLVKRYTFWLVAKLFLSFDDNRDTRELEERINLVASALICMPFDLPGTALNKGIKAAKGLRAELVEIIRRRRAELAEGNSRATEDIISHMILACSEEGVYMNEMEIADKIIALIIGGHHTTSAACAFMVKYLAEFPHVYDAVYEEQMKIFERKGEGEFLSWEDLQKMKYSWNVAQEVLRVAPPGLGTFRVAITDFVFNRVFIPKGWKIHWSAASTHKNSAYFPDPYKFDPSRFEGNGPAPYTFVPFGGGPRMCPGNEYARVVILVFVHNLVKRFKWEKIIPDEGLSAKPLLLSAKGLPVRLFPHANAAG